MLIFIGSWIYCITSYGILFGVGFGWLPPLIAASLGAFLWPVAVLGVVLAIAALAYIIFHELGFYLIKIIGAEPILYGRNI